MDEKTTNRRDFLKLAGTSAPAAVALAATGTAAEAAEDTTERMEKTAHVRKYLDSARF
ncbi:MAG: twin-arginine translocation signal domain-containing protein [Pseudomonadota bacterium]